MKQIHFVLQGKGGCGKSFSASILAQYFLDQKKLEISCYDIDQINTTFSNYKRFNAKHISILDDNNHINDREFDKLVESLISDESDICIVDTGSNTFMPFLQYITTNQAFDVFYSLGIELYIHLILAGGDQFEDTLHGTQTVIEQNNIPSVIWVNEFFGDAIKNLQSSRLMQEDYEYLNLIKGTVLLPKVNPKLHGEDIKILTRENLTLEEAVNSDLFGVMPRMRLKTYFNDVYNYLNVIFR